LTSDRKIKANRSNARTSTGPKTKQGRALAARNALRHGLSLPVKSDPTLSEEVAALARDIAGPNASPERQVLARDVAEAHVDLRRVRYARDQLLVHALRYESSASAREGQTPRPPLAARRAGIPQEPQKFVTILSEQGQTARSPRPL
jgi:hypothetical protein